MFIENATKNNGFVSCSWSVVSRTGLSPGVSGQWSVVSCRENGDSRRGSLRDGIEQLVEKTKIFRSSFADWFSGGHLVRVVADARPRRVYYLSREETRFAMLGESGTQGVALG